MIKDLVKEYRMGESTIWLLCLEDISEADFDEMYACCTKERREAADRIKSGLKRRQSVGAGYLLSLLKKQFFIEEDPVVWQGGKPAFREERNLHFNISHSGGYAVLAYGEAPLGVDIECVKRTDLKVAKRFFRKEEYDYLAEQPAAEQAGFFCRMWTGKEAVVKASGAGFSIPLNSFSVLGEIVECSGNKYELYQQRMTEAGQDFWVSVARLVICTNDDNSHRIL